ncbi:MAG: hypothetical protein AAGG07_01890 [Planctomycetota bacterium]
MTKEEVRSLQEEMEADPKPLRRPVVLLSGYRAPPTMIGALESRLRRLTGASSENMLAITYSFDGDIDDIADNVVERVEREWPSEDPEWTVEVDVVAISMGGLVGRAAADDPAKRGAARKRLNAARIFTLASPNNGAKSANLLSLTPAANDMKPGSEWLAELNGRLGEQRYELIPYAQLNDVIVGARNTTPPGMDPYWTGGTAFFSHSTISENPWVLTDIARRLRGEVPIADEPSAPPSD